MGRTGISQSDKKSKSEVKFTKQQRYSLRHKIKGLCSNCPNPVVRGKTLCKKCLQKYCDRSKKDYEANQTERRLRRKRQKKKYKDNNCCPTCSAPLGEQDEGYVNCINCRLYKTVSKAKLGRPLFPPD